MDTGVRIIRNSAFSFMASVATKVANTLVFILIARRLTVDEVGVYSLALTFGIIFVQLASWGLDQLLVREVARRKEETGRYLVNFLLIRLILSLSAYALLVLVVTQVIHYERATVYALLLAGLTIVFDSVSNICQAVFIAHERLVYITCVALVMSLFKLGATWIGLQTTQGLLLLVGIFVGASLAGMLFSLAIVRWRFLPASLERGQINLDAWLTWLRFAFPFVFVTIFYTLDYQLDSVLLSVWQGEEAVGLYGAANTVLFSTVFISQAFREAIFPVMSRFYPADPVALRRLYHASARWLLAIGLPLALGGALLGEGLMTWLYKEEFRESGRVLQIIIWCVLFLFLNVPNARLMIVAGKQRELAWSAIACMSTNLILNALLIPRHSYIGAALARLASTALFFFWLYTYTFRHLLRFNVLTILPRPAFAAIVMGAATGLMRSWPLLWVVTVGGASYVLTLWLVGFLSNDERAFIKQLVARLGYSGA
jgi:O-antigen/teichoic acid export membrane protein